jgi:hypothetical protein
MRLADQPKSTRQQKLALECSGVLRFAWLSCVFHGNTGTDMRMNKFWLTKARQIIFSGQSHASGGDLMHNEAPKGKLTCCTIC